MKFVLLLAVALTLAGVVPAASAENADKPDIRVSVRTDSLGGNHGKNTDTSSRRLLIRVENREHQPVPNLQVHWKIIARDINSRRHSTAASGKRDLDLDADETKEIESGAAKFTRHENRSKIVGKGKNKRRVPLDDTGNDYAGYVVEITRNGQLIAKAATVGMK